MKRTKELPKISEAEWEVMDCLWSESPMTSQQIIEKLEFKDWNPKTVKTMIFRLEKKGALSHDTEKREYLYYPLVKKESYIKQEGNSFVKKLFNGATAPMVAHFIKDQKLTKEELQDLKKLIDQMEGSAK
ncbi:MAG: BlaI/MecI/CopY family transcriptional regulator [Bdellovibrionales bacterium]|nr:BlaI/MecI/CopY family transcriptional regulator [Bdellovibrionales bacterium]NQZ17962.1 BlaI/MecI/CopY family transcriptional regulator [Bdellovibrionales bacterium]